MISVVVPTLNAAETLGDSLSMLVPAAIEGLVSEVIVVDGGSSDETGAIADAMGAHFISAARGRGLQLVEGARASKGDWLLFLHADTNLQAGWDEEAFAFIRQVERGGKDFAAAFLFALDDPSPAARRLEFWVKLRCQLFRLPYGDQGLLISRQFYNELGGYKPMPLMEDVDLLRRIGRARLALLRTPAITSARRFQKNGYFIRSLRNIALLSLYFLRVPTRFLVKLYG